MKKNAKTHKVAYLMATYNGQEFINDQIASIFSQKKVSPYLFISDDNSSDNTVAIVKDLKRKYKNIFLYKNNINHKGFASNFLFLFTRVQNKLKNFDYVSLCDQDDIFLKNKTIRAINCLIKSKSIGYSSSVIAYWNVDKTKIIKINNIYKSHDFLFEGGGQGCTFVLNVEIFNKFINFYKSHTCLCSKFYFHDWLIYLFFRNNGKWFFDSGLNIYYRQHNNNNLGSRLSLKSIIYRLRMIFNGSYKKFIIDAINVYSLISKDNTFYALKYRNWFKKISLVPKIFRNGRRRNIDNIIISLLILFGLL